MKLRLFGLFFVVTLSVFVASGKDIYVAQSAQGNGNGSDAADAYGLSWFNNTANWGAGAGLINAGDTVHLVGTFTTPLIVAGNGASGSPVTIYFEPGANFTSPCWPSTGAIQLNGNSYIVIDGGANGLIQNTANGTGLANTNNSRGIGGSGNGTAALYYGAIQNLRITNMYTKVKGNYDPTRAGYAVDISGSSITISNCVVSDGDGGLSYSATGTSQSNIFLLNNTMLNCNHTMDIGMGDHNCYLTNLMISGNYMDHWDVWDCPGNSPIHLDGIIIFNNANDLSSILAGTRIFGNTFGGYVGTRTTAAIFNDFGGMTTNFFIYNNLFLCYPPGNWGNGFISAGGVNVWVVNNTCVGTNFMGTSYSGGMNMGGYNAFLYNNLMVQGSMSITSGTTNLVNPSQQGANSYAIVSTYFTNVWSDYNCLPGSPFTAAFQLFNLSNGNPQWTSGILGPNLLDWQTWYENEWGNGSLGNSPLVPGLFNFCQAHCDPHSNNKMPLFDPGTYIPAANDTATIALGTNLFWLGITNDFFGNPRTNSGKWTIGCYEVPKSSAPVPAITLTSSDPKPTNGETLTLTWTSSNATNVSVSGIGSVALNGSTTVSASTNISSYTAYALGPGGLGTAVASVSIRPLPPSQLQGKLLVQ